MKDNTLIIVWLMVIASALQQPGYISDILQIILTILGTLFTVWVFIIGQIDRRELKRKQAKKAEKKKLKKQ